MALVGIGAEDAPLQAACSTARAPYVALPRSRVRHTTLWSLLTPLLQLATDLGLLPEGAAEPEAIAAALDEVARECGPAQESFVNPAKTLALELLDALPVIVAEGPLAGRRGHAHRRPAGDPGRSARRPPSGCPTSGSPPARCCADRWRRARPTTSSATARATRAVGCGCSPSATPTPGRRRRGGAGAALGRQRRCRRRCGSPRAHNIPVSGLAEHGDPPRFARLPRLARQLAVADFTAVYLALALDYERALRT